MIPRVSWIKNVSNKTKFCSEGKYEEEELKCFFSVLGVKCEEKGLE